jgi:hypothetical protein
MNYKHVLNQGGRGVRNPLDQLGPGPVRGWSRYTALPRELELKTLLMNSGLIRKSVAHYMFGYYALRCWESEYFWLDVNRNSPYWAAFRTFVEQMKRIEQGFDYSPRRFRFW